MQAYTSYDTALERLPRLVWWRALRRWLRAPAAAVDSSTAASAWLLYHPPGVVRVMTPAEAEALERVRAAK